MTQLGSWNRVFLERAMVTQLAEIFCAYYETQRMIPCLHNHATGSYLEPYESSPNPQM